MEKPAEKKRGEKNRIRKKKIKHMIPRQWTMKENI